MRYLCLVVFLSAAACSNQTAQMQFNQQGLRNLIHAPVEDVYQKLGTPQKTIYQDGKTLLIYTSTYQNYTAPVAQTYYAPGMPAISGSYTPETCTTVFTIVSQVVQDVTATGNCLF